jgi:hypothetical protein
MPLDTKTGLLISSAPTKVEISGGVSAAGPIDAALQNDDLKARVEDVDDDDEEEHAETKNIQVYSFEIDPGLVEVCDTIVIAC